ncbi:MAG: dihydrodipicolinate synthase family protein [Phycisphaerales bacterium]|jgi:4-hydroxy-tetrahydrodipicolinate synthase|nr:dihydrodipicolinate synthase family protein [Phycisphaerales bacterium]
MKQGYFISAMGTPLTADEQLHEKGLDAQFADQYNNGIKSYLMAGTMGMMQLLSDQTYQKLIERSVAWCEGKGTELMIGAGDASFARSRDRIQIINKYKVDAVVVLAPYFIQFTQAELVDYYRALADVSKAPLYLYDLPVRTRSKIEMPTVLELAKHPNIKGIKVSDELSYTRHLIDTLQRLELPMRVIIAQPDLMDMTIHHGFYEQLDGMFIMAPEWVSAIGECAAKGDWAGAAKNQQNLSLLKQALIKYGIFPACTAVMNFRGLPGNYAPRPYKPLTETQREQLRNEPVVQLLTAGKTPAR